MANKLETTSALPLALSQKEMQPIGADGQLDDDNDAGRSQRDAVSPFLYNLLKGF